MFLTETLNSQRWIGSSGRRIVCVRGKRGNNSMHPAVFPTCRKSELTKTRAHLFWAELVFSEMFSIIYRTFKPITLCLSSSQIIKRKVGEKRKCERRTDNKQHRSAIWQNTETHSEQVQVLLVHLLGCSLVIVFASALSLWLHSGDYFHVDSFHQRKFHSGLSGLLAAAPLLRVCWRGGVSDFCSGALSRT